MPTTASPSPRAALALLALGLLLAAPATARADQLAPTTPTATPAAAPAAAPTAAPAPAAVDRNTAMAPEPMAPPLRLAGFEALAGVGAAALTVPGGLALFGLLANATPDLATSAVPALLLYALVPPFAVTTASWLVGNAVQPCGANYSPAIFSALGVHVAAVVIASFTGITLQDPVRFTLFSVADTVALAGVTTLTMFFTRPRPSVVARCGRHVARSAAPAVASSPLPRARSFALDDLRPASSDPALGHGLFVPVFSTRF